MTVIRSAAHPRRPALWPARAMRCLVLVLVGFALTAAPAVAGSWGNTQHGGRATGQVGAMTARAPDPSAVTYNPAGIARLPGFQLQGGLDFSNPTDEYDSPSGSFRANHTIQFPVALYATYQLPGGDSPWVVGLGIDTPYWYSVDWEPALFPGRFLTREVKARFWEVHPVIAYRLSDEWSVGGGVRYIIGDLDLGQNFAGTLPGVPGVSPDVPFEVELTATGSPDAVSFDAGLQYASNIWGWGAVYRGSAELDTKDSYKVQVRDITVPARTGEIEQNLGVLVAEQKFEIPAELRTGVWFAPYPELRLELDVAYAAWGRTETRIVDPRSQGPVLGNVLQTRTRDWDSTVSIRFGVEGDLSEHWKVFGGVALEPSPVPGGNVEPGFPRGDALVYGAGFTYELPEIAFDVGYSLWDHDNRSVSGQELANPARTGTYSADEQVWSASARFRF